MENPDEAGVVTAGVAESPPFYVMLMQQAGSGYMFRHGLFNNMHVKVVTGKSQVCQTNFT